MLLSDYIAGLIEQMLHDNEGTLEIRRNDMAQQLGCAPSQINYVITSRFTPSRGYIIESHRGGGGYIRIVRKEMTQDRFLMHFYHTLGESLSESEAVALIRNLCDTKIIDEDCTAVMLAAISSPSLAKIESKETKDEVRADILRQIILSQMK